VLVSQDRLHERWHFGDCLRGGLPCFLSTTPGLASTPRAGLRWCNGVGSSRVTFDLFLWSLYQETRFSECLVSDHGSFDLASVGTLEVGSAFNRTIPFSGLSAGNIPPKIKQKHGASLGPVTPTILVGSLPNKSKKYPG